MSLFSRDATEVMGQVSSYLQLIFKQFPPKPHMDAHVCVYLDTHIEREERREEIIQERLDNCG